MPSPRPERQLVTVPVVGGIGTDHDRRMRPPERLEVARNCRSAVLGGLAKRYGFTQVGDRQLPDDTLLNKRGPIRGLARTSREVLAIGHRTLFAYSEALDGWLERGTISPCNGRIQERFRTMAEYDSADLARAGSYVVHAAARFELQAAGTASEASLELRTYSTDGTAMHSAAVVDTQTGFTFRNYLRGVRCAPHTSGVVITYAVGETGAAAELRSRHFATSSPTEVAPAGTTYTTDLWQDDEKRTHDAIGLANGNYVVAWVADSNRAIEIRLYDSSHVQQASASIATIGTGEAEEHWKRVALAESPTASQIYVLAVSGNATLLDKVQLYARRDTDLTAVWGPTTMDTAPNFPDEFDNIGVVEGNDNSGPGADRVGCVWGEYDLSPESYTLNYRSSNTSGASLSTQLITHNVTPLSRPFVYRNRFYAHVMTLREDVQETYGYESHMLVDLGQGDAEGRAVLLGKGILMSALWGVGQAPGAWIGGSYARGGPGSCGTVDLDPDGVTHRFVCPFMTEVLRVDGNVSGATVNDRVGWDEVQLIFDEPVTSEPVFANSAMLGGGYVSYYDGTDVHELGFATPPMVETVVDASAGQTNVPAGDHTYYTMWEHMGAGVLHRSAVSPGVQVTLGANSSVDCDAFALPTTRRKRDDMTCQWFRQSSTLDNVLRRVNRAELTIKNQNARNVPTLRDNIPDSDLNPPIYTSGGVLEAVAPEGARIVTLSNSRFVLGDFFRSSRIQYSHQFEPQTGGEVVIAPEFVEPLGKLTGHGERITGIAPLDTATVVFDERAIYLMSGYGPDRAGRRDDIGRLTTVPVDTGCNEIRSVVSYPDGVMYGTSRGIYALTRDQGITPIGEPVRDLTDSYPVISSAVVVPEERQVRFTVHDAAKTDGRILVYDYRIGKWFEWQIKSAADATVVPVGATYLKKPGDASGTYYIIEEDGQLWQEDDSAHFDNATVHVPMVIELGEMQPAGPQAWMRVGSIQVLAEKMSGHGVEVYAAENYGTTPGSPTAAWTEAQVDALADSANREQLSLKPPNQRLQAIRIRIQDTPGAGGSGEGFVLHAVTFEVGLYGRAARTEAKGRI